MSRFYEHRKPVWILLVLIVADILILSLLGYYLYYRTSQPAQYRVIPGMSIQSVIDSMSAGEICNIQPGTYFESLVVPRSGLTLRKTPGSTGRVILNAGGADNAIKIVNFSGTVIQGLTIMNSADSLVFITGDEAAGNIIRQNTLLEWGINGSWAYPAAVHLEGESSGTTIDSNFMYRGNYEYISGEQTIDPLAVVFWGSKGRHTIVNNIVVGAALDIDPTADLASFIRNLSGNIYAHAVKNTADFGDGYPYYKLNLGDGMGLKEKFVQSEDFDDTVFRGNQLFGSHDNMFQIQAADRNTTLADNYIDCMGGTGAVSIRSASVGPVLITGNTVINFGTFALKYGSWDLGPGNAPKYIINNIFYSSLGRDYTDDPDWYTPVLSAESYSRILDGQVNGPDYDNLHMSGNYAYSRGFFAALQPGSGAYNSFTDNHFSTGDKSACIRWFSDSESIDFDTFNDYTGGTNVWEVISPPSCLKVPLAGALP